MKDIRKTLEQSMSKSFSFLVYFIALIVVAVTIHYLSIVLDIIQITGLLYQLTDLVKILTIVATMYGVFKVIVAGKEAVKYVAYPLISYTVFLLIVTGLLEVVN